MGATGVLGLIIYKFEGYTQLGFAPRYISYRCLRTYHLQI